MPFKDLPSWGDVKGGSPRTPISGVPISEYQAYVANGNGNGVWKAIATGLGGLVVGLLLAWFSAFQKQGVTEPRMQEYVDKYSPIMPKDIATLSGQIGELRAKNEESSRRLYKVESDVDKCDRELQSLTSDVKTKMGTVADMLEQKVKK